MLKIYILARTVVYIKTQVTERKRKLQDSEYCTNSCNSKAAEQLGNTIRGSDGIIEISDRNIKRECPVYYKKK